ncbi:hypothetical protein PPROV_000361700 [Pycnococcus provasolii]|uniref:Alpha-mannosidase n=2 Tax=Pycnococcus provasolii TaxID=41880 RepID=A0A830HCW1_9CHLO|nr:hypothetical protein PPROV_000361700 [Pycnococcus provasolii]
MSSSTMAVTARLLLLLLSALAHVSASTLNVHVVPHTHDDVGWLKTVDQYYKGLRNDIQNCRVELILDTVVRELSLDANKTFVYVEMAFFTMWWRDQSDATKQLVKQLVQNKQLAFANGGYCMHDEAAPDYVAMLDQTAVGHRFLRQEFDYTPSVGWQVDPFGHSHTQATLLTRGVGFDAWYFGREDYGDLLRRKLAQELEFGWFRGQPSTEQDPGLAGLMESGNYGPPPGFDWDPTRSASDFIQDDPWLEDYNLDGVVDDFVAKAHAIATLYRGKSDATCRLCGTCGGDDANQPPRWCTRLPDSAPATKTHASNVMIKMGSDFNYANAYGYFKEMDKLIHHVNERYGDQVNVFYSTPDRYTAARHAESLTWPCLGSDKPNDLFPYEHRGNSYWTGYFTSRPALKFYVYEMQRLMYSARILEVATRATMSWNVQKLNAGLPTARLALALGLVQHHDGVSGTEKQHVADDYARQLAKGYDGTMAFVAEHVPQLHGTVPSALKFAPCAFANASICTASESLRGGADTKRVVALYFNADTTERKEYVRVPVAETAGLVVRELDANYQPKGDPIESQVVPLNDAQRRFRARYLYSATSGKASAATTTNGAVAQLVFAISVQPRSTAAYSIEIDKMATTNARARPSTVFSTSAVMNQRVAVRPTALGEDLRAPGRSSKEQHSSGTAVVLESGVPAAVSTQDGDVPFKVSIALYNSSSGNAPFVDDSDNQWPIGRAGSTLPVPGLDQYPGPNSGAYIFRPNSSDPVRLHPSSTNAVVTAGPIVSEVYMSFDATLSATLRVYPDSDEVEVNYHVGPLMEEGSADAKFAGSEPSITYDTAGAVKSEGRMITDSNGYRAMPRERGTKPGYEPISEPAAGNYYPITAFASIASDTTALGVAVDRPCGAASLTDGAVEVMVHRRLQFDDSLGVGEALAEDECLPEEAGGDLVCRGLMVSGTHRVVLGSADGMPAAMRAAQRHNRHPPVALFAADTGSLDSEKASTSSTSSLAAHSERAEPAVPPLAYVASVELLEAPVVLRKRSSGGQIHALVRVSHMFGPGEDATHMTPVSVDLSNAVGYGQVTDMVEVTLSGNQALAEYDAKKLVWDTSCHSSSSGGDRQAIRHDDKGTEVELHPGDIRAFEVTIEVSDNIEALR